MPTGQRGARGEDSLGDGVGAGDPLEVGLLGIVRAVGLRLDGYDDAFLVVRRHLLRRLDLENAVRQARSHVRGTVVGEHENVPIERGGAACVFAVWRRGVLLAFCCWGPRGPYPMGCGGVEVLGYQLLPNLLPAACVLCVAAEATCANRKSSS